MPSAIWKGSISFGLVQVPVGLYAAESRTDISLQLVDSRNNRRVRYQRVNEETGKEVPWSAIVKGYEYEDGKYVLLPEEEIKSVAVEATQTIEIESFLDPLQIDPVYFDKPYFLVPDKKVRSSAKSYALLREALRKTGKAGLARVVIRTREYVCLVMARDQMLILELVRFPQELHDASQFELPGDNLSDYKIGKKEVDMAVELVKAMSGDWTPDEYHDTYREALMEWIESKIENRDVETVESREEDVRKTSGKVVDLMEHLKKSLEEAKRSKPKPKKAAKKQGKPAAKKAARKRKAG
jgi:DNA end-binding protein Ku